MPAAARSSAASVRLPSGRDQQMRAGDALAAIEHARATPVAVALDGGDRGRGTQCDAFLGQSLGEERDQLGVVARQERAGIDAP